MIYVTVALLSSLYGINTDLTIKIAKLESNMNPRAFSKTKDGGLFQLNSKYYVFHNPEWIFNADINSHLAIKSLSNLKNICKYKLQNQFVLCYNLGIHGASKLKNPESQTYLKKLTLVWRH